MSDGDTLSIDNYRKQIKSLGLAVPMIEKYHQKHYICEIQRKYTLWTVLIRQKLNEHRIRNHQIQTKLETTTTT